MEIHHQQAGGDIYNIEGDVTLWNGCRVVLTVEAARGYARDLRRAVGRARPDTRAMDSDLDEIDAALAGEQPDRSRAAHALDRLVRSLTAAGALAGAGTTLFEVVGKLAHAIGPPALALLGGVLGVA